MSATMDDDDFDYERDDEPCDHEDHDVNLIDGRCQCYRCGESWYATTAEIDEQLRFESEYHEAMERENRRQWWSDLFWAIRHPLATLHWEMQKRGWFRPRVLTDDDIPF